MVNEMTFTERIEAVRQEILKIWEDFDDYTSEGQWVASKIFEASANLDDATGMIARHPRLDKSVVKSKSFNDIVAKQREKNLKKAYDWSGFSEGKKMDISRHLNDLQEKFDYIILNELNKEYDDPAYIQIKECVNQANDLIENARRAVRQNW